MPGITLPEARVMLALVGRLTSWSILEEPIANAQLATATGMDGRAVRKAVASLAERCAIVRVSSLGRRASTYRLPNPNPDSENPGPDDQWSEEPGSNGTANPGSGDPPNPGSGDPLHENYARTGSEEARPLSLLAGRLITTPANRLTPGELDQTLAELVTELGEPAVAKILADLDRAGRRYRWPRELAQAVRAATPLARRQPAAAQPCDVQECNGHHHPLTDPVEPCPNWLSRSA